MVNAKRLIAPIITIGVGFFTFIFMIMDYLTVSYGWISAGSNGYESIGDFFELGDTFVDAAFLGIFIGIALIFLIVAAVAMLAIGILYLLKACANINVLGDAAKLNSLTKLVVNLYFIISVSAAGLYLLLSIINGFDLELGIGYWFLLVLGVGGFISIKLLYVDLSDAPSNTPSVSYKCSSCASSAKASEKFCSKCGSPVIAVRNAPAPEFRCSACNARANAGERFCSKCGSPIVMSQPASEAYRCSSCASPAKAGERFCSKCGSPIIAVRNEAQAERHCPTCGTVVKDTDKFCAVCGTIVNS